MISFDANKLVGQPVAVIDFETDSPDPTICWPVQVAIAKFIWGVSVPRLVYSAIIRPPDEIPEEAIAVHHITNDAVAGAPSIPEVFAEISRHLAGHLLAAYNLPYEWQILKRLMPDCPPFSGLDPLVWAKTVDKYEKSKKLSDVCGRRNIPINAHSAESDTLATAMLLPLVASELLTGVVRKNQWGKLKKDGPWCEAKDFETVGSLVVWTQWAALKEEADFENYCRKEGRPAPRLDWHPLCNAMGFQRTPPKLYVWPGETSEHETKANEDGPEVALGERGESVLRVPDESEGSSGPFFDPEGNEIS